MNLLIGFREKLCYNAARETTPTWRYNDQMNLPVERP